MTDDGRHVRADDRRDALRRSYLGDGAYATWDGFGYWITAEDGRIATDAVYLEPEVLQALERFVAGCRREERERREKSKAGA